MPILLVLDHCDNQGHPLVASLDPAESLDSSRSVLHAVVMLRLTERGRGALLLARDHAEAVGREDIGAGDIFIGLLLVLGRSHADTEHLLLGLMRTEHSYPGTAFTRIVEFEDRLRIRNETLRLAARPPSPD